MTKKVERKMRVFKTVTTRYYADIFIDPLDSIDAEKDIPASAWRKAAEEINEIDYHWLEE